MVVELVAPHHLPEGMLRPPGCSTRGGGGGGRDMARPGCPLARPLTNCLPMPCQVIGRFTAFDPGTPGATFTTHKEVSSPSGTPEAPPANEAPEGPWASS